MCFNLPGNHDYDNDRIDLWETFQKNAGDKTIFLNQEAPVSLTDYGWMPPFTRPPAIPNTATPTISADRGTRSGPQHLNIGIAHGSLQGVSPDIDSSYFYMTLQELENLPLDLWLLGHTHLVYPAHESVKDWKIFNPGTPEPDGLDCRHNGHAWLINVDDHKRITADLVSTGTYHFLDEHYPITDADDLTACRPPCSRRTRNHYSQDPSVGKGIR